MESNEINAIADRISDKLIAIVKKQLGEPRIQPGPRWVKASAEPPVGTPILIYTDGLCLGFYKYWPVGYNGNSEAVYVDLNGRGPISATEVIYWMLPPVHPHEQPAADSKSEPKWVKGALQWAKETIDFAWDYVKVPESLGETWGNMYMNTMHAIQQAQQEIEQPAAVSQDAHEKEIMMQAFDKVCQIFEGRQWVMDGRGSYPYNDDRYQQEVRYMYDEFDQVVKDTWANIKSKSIEYREWIISEYLQKDHPAIPDILNRLGYQRIDEQPAAGREEDAGFRETIENIILSAGKHNQEQCSEIADAILRDLSIGLRYQKKKSLSVEREEDAVAFLAWIQKNDYYYSTHGGGYWYEWNEKEQETYLCNTNDELYKLFKKEAK